MKREKKTYIAPAITIVSFVAEYGYVVSTFTIFDRSENTDMTETYSVREGWGDSENNSFWD